MSNSARARRLERLEESARDSVRAAVLAGLNETQLRCHIILADIGAFIEPGPDARKRLEQFTTNQYRRDCALGVAVWSQYLDSAEQHICVLGRCLIPYMRWAAHLFAAPQHEDKLTAAIRRITGRPELTLSMVDAEAAVLAKPLDLDAIEQEIAQAISTQRFMPGSGMEKSA
jgi:hypothetical protein